MQTALYAAEGSPLVGLVTVASTFPDQAQTCTSEVTRSVIALGIHCSTTDDFMHHAITLSLRIATCCLLVALIINPLLAAPLRHAEPADFQYEPLSDRSVVDFVIGGNSDTFEFQTGVSGFKAFALPNDGSRYLVDIQSFVDGGTDPAKSHVFYPLAALLLEDFLVSRTTELDSAHFELPLLEHAEAPAYRVTVLLDPSEVNERYLVIYTAPPLSNQGQSKRQRHSRAATDLAEHGKADLLGASLYGRLRITMRAVDGIRGNQGPKSSDATR